MTEVVEFNIDCRDHPDLGNKLYQAILDIRFQGGNMKHMDIPSNSEIFLVMSNLISKIEDAYEDGYGIGTLSDETWYTHACSLRDRMMASDLDTNVPPAWVERESCPKCGGVTFHALFSSKESFVLAPHALEFKTTTATLYDQTVNVEFDNRRVRIGSGQTMRRWIKHEEICGVALEDTIELFKPMWLATYKPVNKENSITNLKEILD